MRSINQRLICKPPTFPYRPPKQKFKSWIRKRDLARSPQRMTRSEVRRLIVVALVAVVIGFAVSYWLAPRHVSSGVKATAEHPIIAGPSRSECLVGNNPNIGLSAIEETISSFDQLTGTNVTCLDSYLNGAQNWLQWTHPWASTPGYGYTEWVAQNPSVNQMVFQLDLIPDSLENVSDPLGWETSCAAGDFNSHAVEFAQQMVKTGLGNSVLRLGAEANGPWEADYIGDTVQEQNLWAKCFDNEVMSFRRVKGEHFLIDWNPNAAALPITYSTWYPGNKYVNILGLDFYDINAFTPTIKVLFPSLAHEEYGLAHFEAFAKAKGKPMSFPEWGLVSNPPADDAQYIDGIGDTVETQNFAFEAYFDVADGIGNDQTVVLNQSTTPESIVQFNKWFGTLSAMKPVKVSAPSKLVLPSHLPPKHRR